MTIGATRRLELGVPGVAGRTTRPVVLTIAGTDSGGGAGIAADLRTFAALGVFGTLAITAVTAQDTTKVHAVYPLEAAMVDQQLDAVLSDLPVASAKTGMLATPAIIDLIEERARTGRLPQLVVDPVMVASSGSALVEGDAPRAYRRLFGSAAIVTPNLPEASVLVGRPVVTLSDMADAARALHDLGPALVVVKGGHLNGGQALDIVYDGDEIVELCDEMVTTDNVHGTGCTFSAAIAARLACGDGLFDAVVAAKRYVSSVIRASAQLALGGGIGPLDHLYEIDPGGRTTD